MKLQQWFKIVVYLMLAAMIGSILLTLIEPFLFG